MSQRLIICFFLLCLCGCVVNRQSIVLDKTTVFGLEIAEPTGNIKLRFGLIRNFYQHVPVSTNGPIYSPVYSTSMEGDIGFTAQNVKENFKVGVTE